MGFGGRKHTEEALKKNARPSMDRTYAAYMRKCDIRVGKYLRMHRVRLYNKIVNLLGM